MSEKMVTLNDSNFEGEVLCSEIPVLVDFWAEWCGPCRMIAPAVEQLAEEYAGRLKVGKLNVDENPLVASRFGIRSIPSLLIFKGGVVVEQIVGVQPKASLKQLVERNLS
ncbi:MAG: thioredoxin [Candidatus Tectomicrobia bacterium]|uniref:Thioredoxin n=1 Tax=Tectimicrobiota bacterium TaxID=2528274 RepID=A0A932GQ80_UNCTE|nr:thioredoxin [Candidatus Tectomicrobia bacterium]